MTVSFVVRTRVTCVLTLLTASLIAESGVVHAQVPTKTLVKAEAEFNEPFSSLVGVRELKDGRVVVSDSRDKIVQVVDLKSQRATAVGREGSGPGEYGLPSRLFALPGDSSVLYDPLNSRYLVVLPDGKPGATFRVGENTQTVVSSGGGRQMRMGGMGVGQPLATDGQGRMYFEGSPIVMGPDGPASADSVPIMRYDRRTNIFDTLSFLQLPKNTAKVQSSGSANNRNISVSVGGQTPYPMRDAWTVLPNGTVAVVRASDYHVDLVTSNKQRSRGPAVAYTPVRVGDAEKAEYREAQKRSPAIGIMRSVEAGAGGTTTRNTATSMPPAQEPDEWPAVKPAFSSALASPAGEVWVARNRAAKDEIPRYDVFAANGQLVRTVLLPKQTRVVGFGSGGAVYTVRLDDDDLQYLQRFRGS